MIRRSTSLATRRRLRHGVTRQPFGYIDETGRQKPGICTDDRHGGSAIGAAEADLARLAAGVQGRLASNAAMAGARIAARHAQEVLGEVKPTGSRQPGRSRAMSKKTVPATLCYSLRSLAFCAQTAHGYFPRAGYWNVGRVETSWGEDIMRKLLTVGGATALAIWALAASADEHGGDLEHRPQPQYLRGRGQDLHRLAEQHRGCQAVRVEGRRQSEGRLRGHHGRERALQRHVARESRIARA